MSGILRGVGVALVTPFRNSGEVDFDAIDRIVEYVISGGVDYVVALGTTAETPTLTPIEKRNVFERIKTAIDGRVPLIIGIGGNSTAGVISDFGSFDMNGVEAILSVTPYYNKPTQEGMYQHYSALAANAPRPILLYNVPSRTGVNLLPSTVLRLAREHRNIIGVKEACGDIGQFEELINDRPDGFAVVSGDDCMTLPLIECGGDGVISVAANVLPVQVKNMTSKALDGKMNEAEGEWQEISELTSLMFAEGNPTGVKAAMVARELIANNLRLPLVKASDELYERIRSEMVARGFM